jgi:NADPH:quinone reductase-like Zn-dependent oxidoreductase
MRAFVGTSLGSVDNFVLDHLPTPEPGKGQVRIRTHAAALGFVDGLIVQGRYQIKPPLPYVPGARSLVWSKRSVPGWKRCGSDNVS